jgi:phosphate:Na+ symporter
LQTLLNLLASIALLVWGTHIVRTGVVRVLGADLRRILARSTASRPASFAAGMAVTALVQSSSATALIASSFVGQGLIPLGAALVIMLGADVGAALMALVFSLNPKELSPLLIFFGVVFFLTRKEARAGQVGRVAIGLGLIMLALQLIMAASAPITQSSATRVLVGALSGDPMLGILLGAVITVIAYSSMAVVLLAATFAATGVVSVPVALAIVLGANLASGVIALLVNLRAPGTGRCVALGNLVFKVSGCLAVLATMPWLPQFLAHLADTPRMQVVNFHVAFNAALAAGFFLFADQVGRMVSRWVPPAPGPSTPAHRSHLDAGALETPTLALANAARETLRIGDTIEQMLNGMMEVIRTNDEKRVEELIRLDDDVDRLYTAVKLYLTQISREALDEKDGRRWAEIISLTINLEHVGDVIERILTDIKDKKIAHRLSFSDEGMRELADLHAKLVANLRLGLSVFLTGDVKSAQMLLAEKEKFRDLERSYAALHLDRLSDQSVQSIETSSLHLDIISDMRRINSFFCSTAYPILEQAGQLRKSRLRSSSTGEATGAFSKSDLAARGK